MAIPEEIGVYIYNFSSGGWQRTNAGTPTGFAGVYVYKSSAWQNCDFAYAKASSVWKKTWVNIDGEINLGGHTLTDADFFTTYLTDCEFWFESDGTIDGDTVLGIPKTRSEIATWRNFDCGRDYDIKFTEILSGFTAWTSHPVLNTWLDLSFPATNHYFHRQSTAAGLYESRMEVRIREVASAPAAGNDTGNYTASLENGFL